MRNCILYSEINALCILILLLLFIKVRRSVFIQEQRKLFSAVVLSNAVFLGIDSVWVFFDGRMLDYSVGANFTLNAAYYIVSGIVGFYWFLYSEAVQESKLARKKSYRTLSAIPMVLLAVLTLISYRTGWLFYIDEGNNYHRGVAYAVQLTISYGYVIFTAAKAFICSFFIKDYGRQHEFRALSTFVLPTLASGALQVFFPGYPILCIGNTVGILYVYLTLQEQLVSQDALTKLNNRNQLYRFLSPKLLHPREGKDLYLLIMDIDYFKSINDKYGHIEGDRALKTVAGALMKVCTNQNYFISRFGGDEFVAVCELESGESIEPIANSIHERLKKSELPYKLTLSIGWAKYNPEIGSQQELIDLADKELYKIKQRRRSGTPDSDIRTQGLL